MLGKKTTFFSNLFGFLIFYCYICIVAMTSKYLKLKIKKDIFFEKKVIFSSFFRYVCYFYFERLRELEVRR